METRITGVMHAQHLVEEQFLTRMRFGIDIAYARRRLWKQVREPMHRLKIRAIEAKVVDAVKEKVEEKERAIIKVMVLSAQPSMEKL